MKLTGLIGLSLSLLLSVVSSQSEVPFWMGGKAAESEKVQSRDDESVKDSLWDQSFSLNRHVLPEAAFRTDSTMLAGMSQDGSVFLLSGDGGSYLWSEQEEDFLSIVPGDEASQEALREQIALSRARAEYGPVYQPEGDIPPEFFPEEGEDLFSHIRLSSNMRMAQLIPDQRFIPVTAPELSGMLNTETGEIFLYRDREVLSVLEDTILLQGRKEETRNELYLHDLKTGEESRILPVSLDSEFAFLITATFLPDGSICALLETRTVEYRMEEGRKRAVENFAALILTPEGETEVYALGRDSLDPVFDLIWYTDSEHILTGNPINWIDRKEGSVFCLFPENGALTFASLPETPEEAARGAFRTEDVILDRLLDGKTLLLYGKEEEKSFLIRPEEGEIQELQLTEYDEWLEEDVPASLPLSLQGSNHGSRFFDPPRLPGLAFEEARMIYELTIQ